MSVIYLTDFVLPSNRVLSAHPSRPKQRFCFEDIIYQLSIGLLFMADTSLVMFDKTLDNKRSVNLCPL